MHDAIHSEQKPPLPEAAAFGGAAGGDKGGGSGGFGGKAGGVSGAGGGECTRRSSRTISDRL